MQQLIKNIVKCKTEDAYEVSGTLKKNCIIFNAQSCIKVKFTMVNQVTSTWVYIGMKKFCA